MIEFASGTNEFVFQKTPIKVFNTEEVLKFHRLGEKKYIYEHNEKDYFKALEKQNEQEVHLSEIDSKDSDQNEAWIILNEIEKLKKWEIAFEGWFKINSYKIPSGGKSIYNDEAKEVKNEEPILEFIEPNGTVINHRGIRYEFTIKQGRVIKVMYDFHTDGKLHVDQKDILKKAFSKAEYLRRLFTGSKYKETKYVHPAWGKVIVMVSKGIYKLDLY